jgi:hypothetical protein
MFTILVRLTLAVLVAASTAAPSFAQVSSGTLAKELVAALSTRQLDAFAAKDPAATDAFVAALAYPGVQLLVVSARVANPGQIEAMVKAADYRGVYSLLEGNGIPESKLFVQDMGADGLREDADQRVDVVYEKAAKPLMFSGNVRDDDYRRQLATTDAAYARALRVLLEAARPAPTTTASTALR